MAWTSPMTAVAGSVFTAAQFNSSIRDNLNETAPAKATAAGQLIVSTAANSVAARTPTAVTVAASETTTSTGYAALATAGPVVTVTTGAQAVVLLNAFCQNNTNGASTAVGYDVSSATTIAATDPESLRFQAGAVSDFIRGGVASFPSLTPGSNTFTMKYRVSGGTGTFANRLLIVIPL